MKLEKNHIYNFYYSIQGSCMTGEFVEETSDCIVIKDATAFISGSQSRGNFETKDGYCYINKNQYLFYSLAK